ncbi:MAG: hypothetical protein J6N79_07365, partial [Psychrobacter sp.]|nr:hypothetical protein [Psychrobacter sp.]
MTAMVVLDAGLDMREEITLDPEDFVGPKRASSGFTPQYEPIEQLYKDYHDKGLEVLDIPCNQFGG